MFAQTLSHGLSPQGRGHQEEDTHVCPTGALISASPG